MIFAKYTRRFYLTAKELVLGTQGMNYLEMGGEKLYKNRRIIKTVKMCIKSYDMRNNRFFFFNQSGHN